MTKSDLVNKVADRIKTLSHKEIDMLVDTIFGKMTDALAEGNRIEIRGFGSFEIRTRSSRQGRNPKTGQQVFVGTRRVPFFKVGKELRERINVESESSKEVMSSDSDKSVVNSAS
ncbi:MAG: integration host factor subunit beta [Deltaproteobacteria bacterium]|nr:integration host factor subunit beta [Deltaproteobacteria bacterium]